MHINGALNASGSLTFSGNHIVNQIDSNGTFISQVGPASEPVQPYTSNTPSMSEDDFKSLISQYLSENIELEMEIYHADDTGMNGNSRIGVQVRLMDKHTRQEITFAKEEITLP